MNRDNIPIRTCIGCRVKRPAVEMIRIKVSEKTLVLVDNGTNLGGRSCYICPVVECAEKAFKKGRVGRALRTEVQVIPSMESFFERLRKKGVCG